MVLEFEARWPRQSGAKDEAIRQAFGFSAARYQQVLNEVVDKPAALAERPLQVKRLQRLRDGRARARAARSFCAMG